MFRNISNYLKKWKISNNRKPLIIRGARQVGKTYSITEFGNSSFKNIIKIDFDKNKNARKIFDNDLDIKEVIELIEIEVNQKFNVGETLLFFDEIQCCPMAIKALRYFYEDLPSLHVISAGSLLEFELEKISFPVGRVEFMFMFPLTFEEFLINLNHELLLKKRPNLNCLKPVPDSIHNKFINLIKKYFIIGGLPEAVKTYIFTNNINDVRKVHQNLADAYIQDILKYEKNFNIDAISDVFENITKTIGSPVKYTYIGNGLSIFKVKNILRILEKTLLIHKLRSSSAAALPLGSEINRSVIKICFLDIGLLRNIIGISPSEILNSNNLLSALKGALCEQFIGQELMALGGSQNGQLFYWQRNKKNSNAEVDFLLVRDGKTYPLEIKSNTYGQLKSLHLFLKEHHLSPKGFVFNYGNIGVIDKTHFLPIYSSISFN